MGREWVAASLLLASTGAWPLTTDRERPIQIEADQVLVDEQKRVSTYEGSVILVQGSLRVTASRVEVRRGKEVERVVAEGSPVTFRQRTDQGQQIRGEAQQADYQARRSLLELSGNAHLWKADDEFSGARIIYDAQRSVVRAEGNENGRVSATIHPREKAESQK